MKFTDQEKALVSAKEHWFDEGTYCVHPAGDEIHKEGANDFLVIVAINDQTQTHRTNSLEAAFAKVEEGLS